MKDMRFIFVGYMVQELWEPIHLPVNQSLGRRDLLIHLSIIIDDRLISSVLITIPLIRYQ